MVKKAGKLFIISGEASGDLHGSALINSIKKINPEVSIYGIGGDKMASEGMQLLYHIKDFSFLGFVEVIKHYPFLNKVKKDIINFIKANDINDIVLIDYPGFNLSIARTLRHENKNIIYYISPQIWAWGSKRIKKIKNSISKMIVFFPFEYELYKNNNVPVVLAGHPLIDRINRYPFLSKNELYKKYNIDDGRDILFVMPGSRNNEVKSLILPIIEASTKLANDFNMQIVIGASENIDQSLIGTVNENVIVVNENIYDFLKHSKLGIIKSGTSTLEAGLLNLPMIIVYRTNFITYLLGRLLIKVKNIGLINIVAGHTIVPELIQDKVNVKDVYNECSKLLKDDNYYNEMKKNLSEVFYKLGDEGASDRAAKEIISMMQQ